MNNNNFVELSNNELLECDGGSLAGFVTGLKVAAVIGGAGLAGVVVGAVVVVGVVHVCKALNA